MFGKTNGAKAVPQSGLQMLLKSLGVEFDPKVFAEVGQAVINVRDDLAYTKRQNAAIMAHLGITLPEEKPNGRSAAEGNAARLGSSERGGGESEDASGTGR